MKVLFYCEEPVCMDGTLMRMCRSTMLFDAPEMVVYEFSKYLLSALDTDFHENRFGQVDEDLIGIEKLERAEIDRYQTGGWVFPTP